MLKNLAGMYCRPGFFNMNSEDLIGTKLTVLFTLLAQVS